MARCVDWSLKLQLTTCETTSAIFQLSLVRDLHMMGELMIISYHDSQLQATQQLRMHMNGAHQLFRSGFWFKSHHVCTCRHCEEQCRGGS
jgi:hypothetical protein